MTAPTFRPQVTPLEDRTVPASVNDVLATDGPNTLSTLALGPDNVFAALEQTAQARGILAGLAGRRADQLNIYTTAFLRQFLPTLTVESQKSAAVLSVYQSQLAADPQFGPFVGRVAQQRFGAEVNALYAAALTQRVGGVPVTPVLAPVGPGQAPAAVTLFTPPPPVDTTTSAGLTGTLPDAAAADFRALGDQGLRVRDVIVGQGAAATAADTVNVFYSGFLVDGTRFDTTLDDNQPATFSLVPGDPRGVIAGFGQGLVGVQPGGVRIIDIPSDLGYGAAGQGNIPPNSRLFFEVKLLSVAAPAAGAGTGANPGANGTGTFTNVGTGTGVGTGTTFPGTNGSVTVPGTNTNTNTNPTGTGAAGSSTVPTNPNTGLVSSNPGTAANGTTAGTANTGGVTSTTGTAGSNTTTGAGGTGPTTTGGGAAGGAAN